MVLAGFIRPDKGQVLFGDRDITLLPPHKRDVGMVFQNYALFPNMTVAGNLAYPLKIRRVRHGEIDQRVRRALDMVQLSGFGDRQIDQLSGGQRQRVAVARAIIFEPRILLMDEPLSALDKKLREQMQIEVRHLHQRLGMTTVYVTHDQREALTMSDRIAVIDRGRLRQIGTPRDVYERPANRFVADFIGESTFLPLEQRDGAFFIGKDRIEAATRPAELGNPLLVLRPEKLQIIAGADGATLQLNRLTGTVREIVYQGESTLLYIATGAGEVAVRRANAGADPALDVGAPVTLAISPADTIVVAAESA